MTSTVRFDLNQVSPAVPDYALSDISISGRYPEGVCEMSLLTSIIIVCVLITAGILITGVVSMVHGGQFDERHNEQFMFARVGAQGMTLVLLLLALFLANS